MAEQLAPSGTAQTIRVLSLLDALAAAGLAPSSTRALHELAYLANVLAPVFDLSPMDAILLKRKSGPYYPELQQTIDRLVGRGFVEALELHYELDEIEQRYRISASYRLRRPMVGGALTLYRKLYAVEAQFLDELAAAYGALADSEQGHVAVDDARYADASVDTNNVIDFGQWVSAEKNFSRNAAMAFAPGRSLPPAERLYLYLGHLKQKVAHGR
ncbi:hypothetical protein [Burkholderia pseudomallei]|uniref:hypothetical protein n=1 Tax=Burkholderia pseudomallei TaxID=28450 RepID=UPI0011782FA8|nr:hypothetical protein [Burkholderia pseudomallei]MBF3522432.1 hypothetical protein [Burkholderia pseudomallei]